MATKNEILSLGTDSVAIMKQALLNTSKRTMITNSSIELKEDGEMIIAPTSAIYLLNLGIEYGKLINNKCPFCFTIINWDKK